MAWIEGVRGVLLDVDGTLLRGDEAIPGAGDAIRRLERHHIDYRLITNTTRRPRAVVAEVLRTAGIEVSEERVLTPAVLARKRILESGRHRAALLVQDATRADLEGVVPDDETPQWVVMGDLGPGFTWERMNRAFHWLRDGATLLALQKNPFWHAGDDGLLIDAGAFVAALEFAAGVSAEVVGKPSSGFYQLALNSLGLPATQVMMVGDDLLNDGRGAAQAGCRTAIVRTGKFRDLDLRRESFRPNLVIGSIAELLDG
jgi:HAD superfamily hydrolase (TIGR01458 family)